MKKTLPAFLAALLITSILAAGMFLMGQDAQQTSASVLASNETATDLESEYLSQLEQTIQLYQDREVQYQTELNSAIERLDTANQQLSLSNQQIQEYQNLLTQLQDSGLITIANDGTVTINQTFFAERGARPERNH